MRAVTPAYSAEISRHSTRPFVLVELVAPGITYRWSSGPDVTWAGESWSAVGLQLEQLRAIVGGGQEGQISLHNFGGGASALVLGSRINDAPVRIWKLYGDGPYDSGDEVQIFDGVADGQRVLVERVTIDIVTSGRERELSPRLYYDAFCSHIPPAGTVLSWEGEHYRLESRHG